jgi:hypothetical protein
LIEANVDSFIAGIVIIVVMGALIALVRSNWLQRRRRIPPIDAGVDSLETAPDLNLDHTVSEPSFDADHSLDP